MEKVLTLSCLLIIVQQIAAQCGYTMQYTQTLVPECAGTDVYINWPNYENPASYYSCNGAGNPVLMYCSSGEYFCYVMQECVSCANYIPPVQCSQLKTYNTPNCVAMGSVTPAPAPTPAPTPASTPAASSPAPSTDAPTQAPPTDAPPTEAPSTDSSPAVNPGTTPGDVIGPPSPVTNNPTIPMPSTPLPTPPSVEVDPPLVPPVV